jgi:hypothetical protein
VTSDVRARLQQSRFFDPKRQITALCPPEDSATYVYAVNKGSSARTEADNRLGHQHSQLNYGFSLTVTRHLVALPQKACFV